MRPATAHAVVAGPDGGQHLPEALGMVAPQLVDAGVQPDEAVLVGGQDLDGLVLVQPVEGGQEVAQRVDPGLGVVTRRWG